MSNNSNQSGALLLLAVVLGAAVYALMFFGNEMEQSNLSASFGNLSNKSSANLLSSSKKAAAAEFSAKEVRSDLSGVFFPNQKMKSTSGGNYAQSTNVDFPTIGIEQSDVQDMNQSTSTSRTGNYASNQSQVFVIGSASVNYISNPQNPTKSDINALLLLDTRAAETALSTQQGSKRSTPALAAKTASVSTSLSDKKAVKKIGGDPGDPGASLPIGDGVWVLLAMAAAYSVAYNRFFSGLTRCK